MVVRVRAGRVASAIYADDGTAVAAKLVAELRTIDGWLTYIERGRQRGYHRLQVSYHAELGCSLRLDVDVQERVADDEERVVISALTTAVGN